MILPLFRREPRLPASAAHLAEDRIHDFVDGLMRAADRASVMEHLAACAGCRTEIAELSELVGIARADSVLVVAPPELEIVVLATTIHQRFVKRHFLRVLRLPLAMTLLTFVTSSVGLTVWILTACTTPARSATVGSCTEPWYFVARDGARERYKELRNDQRFFTRELMKSLRR